MATRWPPPWGCVTRKARWLGGAMPRRVVDRHPTAGGQSGPAGDGKRPAVRCTSGDAAVPEALRGRSGTAPRTPGRGERDHCLLPASGRAPDARRIPELADTLPDEPGLVPFLHLSYERRRGPARICTSASSRSSSRIGSRGPRLLAHPGTDAGRIRSPKIERQ